MRYHTACSPASPRNTTNTLRFPAVTTHAQVLKLSAASGPAAAADQLGRLLDQELERGLQLARDVAASQQKEVHATLLCMQLWTSSGPVYAPAWQTASACQHVVLCVS